MCETDSDEDYTPPQSLEKKSDTVTLSIPRKGLLKGAAQLAVRCRVSNRVATALTAKFIKLGGGSLKGITLSKSSSQRERHEEIVAKAAQIRSAFKANMPQFLVAHWDSKVIKYKQQNAFEDRLGVVVSYPTAKPNTQFLAAPRIPDSKGLSMKNAVMDTLEVWEIPNDRVIGICWDTTASNTGCRIGSATLVEQELGRAVLHIACRHHVGELHVKHADEELRGKWNGKK